MGIEYIQKDAIIAGVYRYALTRRWKTPGLGIMWIMLNPSTADANEDDNTIRKIVKISKNHGFGMLMVCNMYAYRATKSEELFKDNKIDYIGERNDMFILDFSMNASCVIIACGAKAKKERIREVLKILNRKTYCLGYNKNGTPVHPLYQKDTASFIEYDVGRLK